MLSWIRNLHTCNTELVLVKGPGQAAAIPWSCLPPRDPPQHPPCEHGASPRGRALRAPMGALARGTYCLGVSCDPVPLAGRGQLCCLLQDFGERQEVVEKQEPFSLRKAYACQRGTGAAIPGSCGHAGLRGPHSPALTSSRRQEKFSVAAGGRGGYVPGKEGGRPHLWPEKPAGARTSPRAAVRGGGGRAGTHPAPQPAGRCRRAWPAGRSCTSRRRRSWFPLWRCCWPPGPG